MVRRIGIRLRSFGRFVTAIVVLIALPTCLVFAQTSTATILGVVKDTSGALVPGVSITVKHTETGLTRTAISSESGDYNVPLLPVGAYELTAALPGFKQQVRSGINLARFLINGVDWIGGQAAAVFITPTGASSQLLGVEAVREYNVVEHTYGAEYGKRVGGQVSIVTSSGTNQWHGNLFEYHRNSALDAKNYFEPTKGPFKRHQFGGTIGGPLKKDKLFVFGNYEGFQQRLAQSNRSIDPDVQSRQGLLPCYLAYPSTPGACPDRAAFVPVPNLKPGMPPFANAFWPVPNGPEVLVNGLATGTAYNYNSGVQKVSENFVMTRMDYVISPKDSLFGNYTFSDGQRDSPQADTFYTMFVPLRTQSFSLQETHVISPSVVNSATLGWVRPYAASVTKPNGTGGAVPANLIFLPPGNPGQIVIGGGASTVTPASVTPAPGVNPLRDVREFYSVADDLRFTRGKHFFSAGVWVQRIHENHVGNPQFSAGGVSYSTMLTFLQDIPSSFNVIRNPVALGYRSTEGAWYFQDEMKLRSNLTVRLGLRHEMTNGWNEVTNRCANYRFDKNFVISTEPVMGHSCLEENHAKLLLQPRVGIAWDPTGRGTWAVRAGFGIHNDLQDILGNRGLNLQFRAEAFNVLNHPNFGYPNEVVFQGAEYSPSGGVITNTATTSRQIQFALKLLF